MLGSIVRSNAAVRSLLPVIRNQLQSQRNGSDVVWRYRKIKTDIPSYQTVTAEVLMGVMWYWMFFHLYYQFGHLTGEFPNPDPRSWSDKELGIPPDDSD